MPHDLLNCPFDVRTKIMIDSTPTNLFELAVHFRRSFWRNFCVLVAGC